MKDAFHHQMLSDSELAVIVAFTELEEWACAQFLQISAIADTGTRFSIMRADSRWRDGSLQYIYYTVMEELIEYIDSQNNHRSFGIGDHAFLALGHNAMRERIHERLKDILDQKGPAAHMTLKRVEKDGRKNVVLCHVSQWEKPPIVDASLPETPASEGLEA